MIESLQQDIRRRFEDGELLEPVYDDLVVEHREFDEEQRAALWLYAWHCSGRDESAHELGSPEHAPALALA
jgi:hypothetical protein